MQLFYHSEIDAGFIHVEEEESKHIVRVLRMKTGEKVLFTNGKGWLYQCKMVDNHPKRCKFQVFDKVFFPKNSPHIHIAAAPTKNIARFEWFVEKAVETGIDEITPIICDHSERSKINRDRLEKIAVSAMKQSFRKWLPKINEIVTFDKFAAIPHQAKKAIAYIGEHDNELLKNYYRKDENAIVLIGPEGDFSKTELQQAINNGFHPISLGENRLRTETAALVACQTILFINQ
jgi:16S rRNA (uracil1498-N3)-methyltransferase